VHADAAVVAAAAHLRRSRWRVDVVDYDAATGDGSVAAEKGFARETGNLIFHLSLLALLFAVAYGALLGWRGMVVVRQETGFSNTLTQYDSFSPGRFVNTEALPPFNFKLGDFDVDFQRGGDQDGAPRRFAATLDWTERPGAPVQRSVVEVNSPLEVDGVKVFLLGHGYAPRVTIRDKAGSVVFSDTVVFLPQDGSFASTGVIKLPDVDGGLGFKGVFLPTAALVPGQGPISTFPAPDDPALFFTAYGGDLGMNSGVPQSVYSLDTTDLTRLDSRAPLRVGETWTLKDGQASVTFDSVERFGSFVVAQDPGKEPALIASIAAIAGLLLSLFVTRRRAWVKVSAGAQGRTLIEVAGLARSEAPGLKREIDDLAAAVAGQAPPLLSDSVRSDPLERLDPSTPGTSQEESRL
jgi:cytochrome c biogenesis protein